MKNQWLIVVFYVICASIISTSVTYSLTSRDQFSQQRELELMQQRNKCGEDRNAVMRQSLKKGQDLLRVLYLLHHIYVFEDGKVGSPKMQKALEELFENQDTVAVDKLLQETGLEAIQAWEMRSGEKYKP